MKRRASERLGMLLCFFTALILGLAINTPMGQAKDPYPSEKITFILPYTAGSGYDLFARAVSPYISKYLKVVSPGARSNDILVKNEYGAAGRKGYTMLFNSKPDGYTIALVDVGIVTDNIFDKPEFDFSKLTFLAYPSNPVKMILASKTGYKSWSEANDAMKKAPVKMAAGQFGRGHYIYSIITNEQMKLNLRLIPVTGTPESFNAVMRGDVGLVFAGEDNSLALIESKELKPLLVYDDATEYPGAVTTTELGYPELSARVSGHRFLVGPPGMAPEAREVLIAATKRALADPEFVAVAKKARFHTREKFGKDAEKVFVDYTKFIEEQTPVLKKYLK